MENVLRFFFAAGLVAIAAIVTAASQLHFRYARAAVAVCTLVDENFYLRDEPAARKFNDLCLRASARQPFLWSKASNIQRLNDRLASLQSSHLMLYDPDENRQMWESVSVDTGLRARLIEDEMVVFRVLPESAAEALGLRAGDSLRTLNGERVTSQAQVTGGSGALVYRRAGVERGVTLVPTSLYEDLSPQLEALDAQTGVLRLASFLPQYFEAEAWLNIASHLTRFSSLIVDLRDNAGGSFPAMLRAFSTLTCGKGEAGTLFHQGSAADKSVALPDDLNANAQVAALGEAQRVRLNAFAGYGCFNGPIVVLTDAGTTSTAEIFARAMRDRPRTRLLGQPTAGEVVMARWFPISDFGSLEYALSIPIAGYAASDGGGLEGRGVEPQVRVYYELPLALRGEDGWLREARHHLELLRSSKAR